MDNIKFETTEEMYMRLLKESAAKGDQDSKYMLMEAETHAWLQENDPAPDEDF